MWVEMGLDEWSRMRGGYLPSFRRWLFLTECSGGFSHRALFGETKGTKASSSAASEAVQA